MRAFLKGVPYAVERCNAWQSHLCCRLLYALCQRPDGPRGPKPPLAEARLSAFHPQSSPRCFFINWYGAVRFRDKETVGSEDVVKKHDNAFSLLLLFPI